MNNGLLSLPFPEFGRYQGTTPAISALGILSYASDPYVLSTPLIVNMEGSNGSTTLTDISTNAYALTFSGSASNSNAQAKIGSTSLYLSGSGTADYVTVATSSSGLDMTTNNFTVELWVYPVTQTGSYPSILASSSGWASGSFALRYNNSGYSSKFTFHNNPGGDPQLASSSTYSTGAWYHLALTRNSTALTLWVNGASAATATISAGATYSFSYGGSLAIGRSSWDGSGGYFKGYIDGLRVSKVCRYTSSFTPDVAAYQVFDSATHLSYLQRLSVNAANLIFIHNISFQLLVANSALVAGKTYYCYNTAKVYYALSSSTYAEC